MEKEINKNYNKKNLKYFLIFVLLLVIIFGFSYFFIIFPVLSTNTIDNTENNLVSDSNVETNSSNNSIEEKVYTEEDFKIDISSIDLPNINSYVALGDSITYGTSLLDYTNSRFSSLLANNLRINTENYGIDGMTSEWLLSDLNKGKHSSKIKQADLITLSIGSNDLLIAFYKAVASAYGLEFYDNNVIDEAKEKFLVASLSEKYDMIKKLYNEVSSPKMKTNIDKAYKNYEKNFSRVIKYLKKENPTATIVAVEYYNPYHTLSIPFFDETSEKINKYLDTYVEKLNNYLYKNQKLGYKIAYIKDNFYLAKACNSRLSLFTFNLDPHPNKLGHYIIYSEIIKTLNQK